MIYSIHRGEIEGIYIVNGYGGGESKDLREIKMSSPPGGRYNNDVNMQLMPNV